MTVIYIINLSPELIDELLSVQMSKKVKNAHHIFPEREFVQQRL